MNSKKRLFEVMHRLNPEMVLNEQDEHRNPPFVDDDRLSVGELKEAIKLYMHSKSKEELLANAKKSGSDILKCVIGLIGVAGFVAGTVGTGGALAAVAGGAAMGVAGTAATASDIKSLFKKLLGPKTNNSPKTPNGFMQLLNIDKEVSILLDDRIENEFVDYAVQKLTSMSDTEPVPNFFEELRGFIKQKYAQVYNIAFSSENPS